MLFGASHDSYHRGRANAHLLLAVHQSTAQSRKSEDGRKWRHLLRTLECNARVKGAHTRSHASTLQPPLNSFDAMCSRSTFNSPYHGNRATNEYL